MRKRYSVESSGVPISQEELDLIFDYTCDACESYILQELMGRHGWELKVCEDFLMGKHSGGNKIRYCSETVTTSILNLKFASRFDSLSRTSAPSLSTPNLASLILTNPSNATTSSQSSSSFSSLPSFASTTPPSSSSMSSLPGFAPNYEKSSPSLVTSSAPQTTSFVPSTHASPASSTNNNQRPVLPPRTGSIGVQNQPMSSASASQLSNPSSGYSHLQTHTHAVSDMGVSSGAHNTQHQNIAHPTSVHASSASTLPLSHSTPALQKSPPPDVGPKPIRMAANVKVSTPPKSSTPASQASMSPASPTSPASDSSYSSDLSDGRLAGSSGKVCKKISALGFCSPRDCADIHSPEWTMCKHLTLNGQCLVRSCPYQHPNVATRQAILTPIVNGNNCQYIGAVQSGQSLESIQQSQAKELHRPLSLAEWNTLRLTMVFYCPIQMREKKCGKSTDCAVIDCPKQHKKIAKVSSAASPSDPSASAPAKPAPTTTTSTTHKHPTIYEQRRAAPKPVITVVAPQQVIPKAQSTSHLQTTSSAPVPQHAHTHQPSGPYAAHQTNLLQAKPATVHHGHPPPALPPKNSVTTQPHLVKAHVASSSTPGEYYHEEAHAPAPAIVKPKYALKDVTGQANHMNLVSSIMQGGSGKTGKALKIKKLQEVHNELIDAQYKEYFTTTQKQKDFRPSEIYAFHGAPAAAVASIAENGFDMSKIKRTKFGHGLYCALDPNVSVEYCGTGNQMLLVRLITDGLKWVKDPAYYVVHNSSSMNPLYIITFEK